VRYSRVVWPVLCLNAAAFVGLPGQELAPLLGLPARVTPRCSAPNPAPPTRCATFVGTLIRTDSDSLTLRTADNVERRFAWPMLDALAVSHRRHGHVGRGVLIGGGLGLAIGEGLRSSCASTGSEDAGLCVIWFLITVPSGMLVGGITGALIRSPTWEPVPLPAPQAGGTSGHRFGLSIRTPW
jgi:hypothetical protein